MSSKIGLLKFKETGSVAEIRQDVLSVLGLRNCMNGQLVVVAGHSRGLILGFDPNYVLVLLIQMNGNIKPGDTVVTTMEEFRVPVGEGLLGRRVNALCEPRDGQGTIQSGMDYPIFGKAPTVLERDPLRDVIQTGTKIVDMTLPIGKGQRMLILGDRMTGKTTVGLDAIVNQRGKDVFCIYCGIGKAEAALERVCDVFDQENVWEYGMVVAATAADSMGQQYLVPYVACSIGEYFMYEKQADVLVVFDDFTKHAWAYRQISLLLERAPGRDAYPGDIFYIHSMLVERACKLQGENAGSMTHLPIVETLQGDFAGYIPSNIISMTDGQIFLNSTLFGEGFKPAIDMGLSVSRIGNRVQWPAMKKPTGKLKLEYVRFKELERLTRIKAGSSGDLDERLIEGKILEEVLKQEPNAPIAMEDQVFTLFALQHGVLKGLMPSDVRLCIQDYIDYIRTNYPDIVEELVETKTMSPELDKRLQHATKQYKASSVYH